MTIEKTASIQKCKLLNKKLPRRFSSKNRIKMIYESLFITIVTNIIKLRFYHPNNNIFSYHLQLIIITLLCKLKILGIVKKTNMFHLMNLELLKKRRNYIISNSQL
jgi:hypothetical protein